MLLERHCGKDTSKFSGSPSKNKLVKPHEHILMCHFFIVNDDGFKCRISLSKLRRAS